MLMKLFTTLIILAAIIISVLALVAKDDQFIKLIIFRDFFDVALPILGFGALIKYLYSCPNKKY